MTETFLFIDTETTGFKKSGPLIQQGQARVCQVAMILADDIGRTLAEYQSMIIPVDWDTNGKTENYYGLSYVDCALYGVHQRRVMEVYENLSSACDQLVAHNSNFDKGMMEVEEAFLNKREDRNQRCGKPWYCTMENNKHLANGKWPKLEAALKHYTNRDLINAHDAMADTRACRDIFFAMRGIKL